MSTSPYVEASSTVPGGALSSRQSVDEYARWRSRLDDWQERLAQRERELELDRKAKADVLRLEESCREGVEYRSWRDRATSSWHRDNERHSPGLNSSLGSGAVPGSWRERSHHVWRGVTGAAASSGVSFDMDREWHLALQKNVEAVRAARRQREETSFRDRVQSGRTWLGHPDIMMRLAGPAWRDLNESRVRDWTGEQEQRSSQRVRRAK